MNSRLIIVNHIGTSVIETIETEIYPLIEEIKERYNDYDVVLGFSSLRSRNKLERKGIYIKGIEEVLSDGILKGYEEIVLFPLHVVGGDDYQKTKGYISHFCQDAVNKGKKFRVLEPLMASENDCKLLADAIYETLSVNDRHKKLLFIGHGTLHSTDSYYKKLDRQLCQLKLDVNVTTLNHLMNISQEALKTEINSCSTKCKDINNEEFDCNLDKGLDKDKEIVVFPLFAVSGHHVKRDLFDSPDSLMERLKASDFKVTIYDKGLVAHSRIRNLYLNRLSR